MSAVEDGRAALLSYLADFGLDAMVTNRIEVILEELVSNVVRHGKDADSLSIEAECCDGAVRLAIEDNGTAFNPLDVVEPAPFDTVEQAPLGRQGIPLIRRLTRSVRYDRTASCNRISAVIAAH